MKHTLCLIIAGTALLASSGCKCYPIQLKDLDRDMPEGLLNEYRSDVFKRRSDYTEKGRTSLPLFLYFSESRIFKGPDDEFQALRKGSGVFRLAYYGTEDSRFDLDGRLLAYSAQDYWLAGLLLSEKNKERKRDSLPKESKFLEGSGDYLLWRCLGYSQALDGQRTIRFLWIPIPAGGGKPAEKPSATEQKAP